MRDHFWSFLRKLWFRRRQAILKCHRNPTLSGALAKFTVLLVNIYIKSICATITVFIVELNILFTCILWWVSSIPKGNYLEPIILSNCRYDLNFKIILLVYVQMYRKSRCSWLTWVSAWHSNVNVLVLIKLFMWWASFPLKQHYSFTEVILINLIAFTFRQRVMQKYIGALNFREQIRSCITPCGSFVFSGSEDNCAYAWNTDTG